MTTFLITYKIDKHNRVRDVYKVYLSVFVVLFVGALQGISFQIKAVYVDIDLVGCDRPF